MVDTLGICNSSQNTIDLKEGMQFEKGQEVLLHEVLHAISDLMEIGLKEKQVSTLAVGVYQFLKDNDFVVQQSKKSLPKTHIETQRISKRKKKQ
jgi:flagellar assembly factor FliW